MIRGEIFLIAIAVIHVYGKQEGKACSAGNKDTCNPCGITGKWVNELGSKIEITCKLDSPDRNSTGEINGKYNSAVGAAQDYYPLSGRFTIPDQDPKNCIVGFVVAWNNMVIWILQLALQERIIIRILTRYKKYTDMWENNNIGKNVFTRVPIK
ncbi:Hypothetical predicted protein [Mytilus galloprovincialis]|uniref:Uncharacterized protein n=1 Tax=Mytilus galloprovincialis TaxID=29158 RepID=A0A8B6G8M0_MYTGA|nr:Hypothetical predicted protein [Mytilus galloprovincialis]